jgi:transcriptional regulator with XRE-family HTH domain
MRVFYFTAKLYLGVIQVSTNLSQYIKQERVKQGLNYAELSRKMGYKNFNKGMRRVIDLERDGEVHHKVLEKIIDALELDRNNLDLLIKQNKEQKRREFDELVNSPIKWHLIIKFMPAVYDERDIPGYIKTEEEAVKYAKSYARENKLMLWLVLSRKENIHIDKDGIIKSRNIETVDLSWLPGARIK